MPEDTTLALVVATYLAGLIAIGVFMSKRVALASDFLIAGRKLGLPLTTATLAAVQLGAGIILGGSAMAAEFGVWPGVWYGLGCGGGLILAGLLVAGKMRRCPPSEHRVPSGAQAPEIETAQARDLYGECLALRYRRVNHHARHGAQPARPRRREEPGWTMR